MSVSQSALRLATASSSEKSRCDIQIPESSTVNRTIQQTVTTEAAINQYFPLVRMLIGSGGGVPEGLRLFLDLETPASSLRRVASRSEMVLRAIATSFSQTPK